MSKTRQAYVADTRGEKPKRSWRQARLAVQREQMNQKLGSYVGRLEAHGLEGMPATDLANLLEVSL